MTLILRTVSGAIHVPNAPTRDHLFEVINGASSDDPWVDCEDDVSVRWSQVESIQEIEEAGSNADAGDS